MKWILRGLLVVLGVAFTINAFAQAPSITYNPAAATVTGNIPFSTSPANTGGAVPATQYGQVSTFAGGTTSLSGPAGYVNGNLSASLFNSPQSMVFDASGNLYITDSNNNDIRIITPGGMVSTFAGSTTGASGFTDGQDTSARFNLPNGIAIDASGNLYVADYYNYAIRKITPGGLVSTFYTGTQETFDPTGMCFDGSGNLVIALQTASQIVKLSPAGVLTVIAGVNPYVTDINGIPESQLLGGPTDVKMDALGNFFVADAGGSQIKKIAPDGTMTLFAGNIYSTLYYGNGTGAAVAFTFPTGIQIMPDGTMYVCDMVNNDIRKMLPDGTVSLFSGYVPLYPADSTDAGNPTQQPGYVNGPLAAAQFNEPVYFAVDNTGNMYISEYGPGNGGNRIRKIVMTGYSISGTLPAGLTFDATTGIISGTVTTPFAAQTDTVTAYNAAGSSAAVITLTYQPQSAIAMLANLVPGSGVLSPVFSSGTTAYADSVSNSTTGITITPTTTDSTATVTVNGTAVTSDMASGNIPITVGNNTINVIVTAQDGTTMLPYNVVVTRAASAIATLSGLTLSNGALSPAFGSSKTSYTVTVGNTITSITETPITSDPTATITVNGTAVNSGSPSAAIALSVGSNTITTVVTAQNGTTTDAYTLTVTRTPSSNAKLSYLGLSQVVLSPSFATATTSYTASVANTLTSTNVEPIEVGPGATITVNGVAVASGASTPVSLSVGANTINTVVTAQDGVTQITYTVVVTRAPSAIATLSNLTLSSGGLSPAFAGSKTSYTAIVGNAVASITETPTSTDPTATITVNGTGVTSGSPSGGIALTVGSNTITTIVTAQNGTTTDTYTVTVTRTPSSNAKLSYLGLSQVVLSPSFATATTSYTASVANSQTSTNVLPIEVGPGATIAVNGVAVASGASTPVALSVGSNTINTVVTAQDGVTQLTYTATITRAPSAIATLSNLTLSNGALTPAFAGTKTSYTATVGNTIASITETPTTTDPTATVTVNGTTVASGSPSGAIALSVGSNTITTVVTAQNGTTTDTYTVTVIRSPSSNAKLSYLGLSKVVLSPAFATATTSYTASVTNAISSTNVEPIEVGPGATIAVNGVAVASGASTPVALNVGANVINTVVTAQDGVTQITYTVLVTRAAPTGAYAVYQPISVEKPADSPQLADDGILVHQGVSPNGDGIDDYLRIDGITQYPDNQLTIINRSGMLIYEAKGYDNSSRLFDGHSNKNGQMQLPGTYFYSLDYTVGGVIKHRTGYIVLKY